MSPPEARFRLLIVDDDPTLRSLLRRFLTQDYDVDEASSVAAARVLLAGQHYHLVLCDVVMPGANGTALLALERDLADRVIFMTGGVHDATVCEELERSGCPVLAKPFELTELEAAVAVLLRRG